MNHYGISAIHWNADLGEIDEVLLHKLVWHEHERMFAFEPGEPTTCSDVVRRIRGDEMVWVLQDARRGSYKNTDHVGINVKRDRQAYLYSCTKDGTPTPALTDLPRYPKPDDPPLDLGSRVARAHHPLTT